MLSIINMKSRLYGMLIPIQPSLRRPEVSHPATVASTQYPLVITSF
jgi:hypothetical protein